MCIVMEYCDKGSLLDVVSTKALSFDALLHALAQVFKALLYCHSRGILHCDIKLDNIFVVSGRPGEHDRLKVGDFGLATPLRQRQQQGLGGSTHPNDNANSANSTDTANPTDPANSTNSTNPADLASTTRPGFGVNVLPSAANSSSTHEMFASTVGGTPCYQPPELFKVPHILDANTPIKIGTHSQSR
jgi:serine/threonine protein kinase